MRQQQGRWATDVHSGRLTDHLLPSARHVVMILLLPAVVVTAVSIVRASTSSSPRTVNPGRARPVAEGIGTRPALSSRARQESTAVHLDQPDGATIGVSDGHLTLGGLPYRFVGVNAYELATDWGTNSGCGANETDAQLDELFSSLAPNSLVRMWAFQSSMATNVRSGGLDWEPLDRVFAAAAKNRQRLIVVLTDQGGTCDGNVWQGPTWYQGGFMHVPDATATTGGHEVTALSYWEYLQAVVNRYKNSPALGMWEPVSEPEASTLGKPIIGGEVGEKAGSGSGCPSLRQRAMDFTAKLHAQMQAGSSGLLVWDWLPASNAQCTTDATPDDPLVKIVDAGVSS